jgi:hypothetical protein
VEHKEAFLTELVQTCAKESGPVLVGGDFNIIRSPIKRITIDTMIVGLSYLMLLLIAWIYGSLSSLT